MPTNPAPPTSLHNKQPTINVSNGDIHKALKKNDAQSNRFTSFESKFTTLPGDVSPRAVCERRRACNLTELIIIFDSENFGKKKKLVEKKTNLSIDETAYSHSNFHAIVKRQKLNMINEKRIERI